MANKGFRGEHGRVPSGDRSEGVLMVHAPFFVKIDAFWCSELDHKAPTHRREREDLVPAAPSPADFFAIVAEFRRRGRRRH